MNKIHVSICNFKITVFFKCIIIIDIYLLTQDYNINKPLKNYSLYRLFSRISNLNRFLWDFHDSTDNESPMEGYSLSVESGLTQAPHLSCTCTHRLLR